MLYNFTLKNRLNNSYVNFCQLDVCIEYFKVKSYSLNID